MAPHILWNLLPVHQCPVVLQRQQAGCWQVEVAAWTRSKCACVLLLHLHQIKQIKMHLLKVGIKKEPIHIHKAITQQRLPTLSVGTRWAQCVDVKQSREVSEKSNVRISVMSVGQVRESLIHRSNGCLATSHEDHTNQGGHTPSSGL
jgi:hypothetical protein